ncbi:undecaprenyl-diphosphate phosphatase [Candidatus Parcubacteria bacterium]|nr:undecaprenyl-diphosphate phosphatase [Candidatus Parcubacteria bacterium]
MWDYITLGILQGLFEWVPVSSEGIVALASQFFVDGVNPIDTALFLHLGTLLAVLVYFRKDWAEILTLKNVDLFRFITIATIISLLVGLAIYHLIRDIAIGPGLLLIMGIGLLMTAYFQKQKRSLNLSKDWMAILVGILQGIAVIPGVSRSGSTIFGLSLGRFTPQEILKISYMLSAPAVLASSVYLLLKDSATVMASWPALITAFAVGFLSLDFLLKLAKKINFSVFALTFGLLCLAGAALGMIMQ